MAAAVGTRGTFPPVRRGWRKALVRLLAIAALAASGAGLAYVIEGYTNSPTVDATTLPGSLQGQIGSLGAPGTCSRTSASRWRCVVPDKRGRAVTGYDVLVVSAHCWEATRTTPTGHGSPRFLRGCVR
jgi:hypothetical protein